MFPASATFLQIRSNLSQLLSFVPKSNSYPWANIKKIRNIPPDLQILHPIADISVISLSRLCAVLSVLLPLSAFAEILSAAAAKRFVPFRLAEGGFGLPLHRSCLSLYNRQQGGWMILFLCC